MVLDAPFGGAFRARVDGPPARGLWPPDGGGLCRRVVKEKVLRIDRPDGRRVLKFDGPSGRGLWIALRAMLMKSALRDWLSVSYVTQYPVPPIFSFPLEGKCHVVAKGCTGLSTDRMLHRGPDRQSAAPRAKRCTKCSESFPL